MKHLLTLWRTQCNAKRVKYIYQMYWSNILVKYNSTFCTKIQKHVNRGRKRNRKDHIVLSVRLKVSTSIVNKLHEIGSLAEKAAILLRRNLKSCPQRFCRVWKTMRLQQVNVTAKYFVGQNEVSGKLATLEIWYNSSQWSRPSNGKSLTPLTIPVARRCTRSIKLMFRRR